jgi:hypothetical protein
MAATPPGYTVTSGDPNQWPTINALYRKSIFLHRYAGMASAVGPHTPNPALTSASGTAAQQEADNCYNRAEALATATAYTFPGAAILAQVGKDCDAIDNAIRTSADWATLIANADTLVKSMPASCVKTI